MPTRSREKIWVVREGDGKTVSDIVTRIGEAKNAIADGRVFIGKRRAMRSEERVMPGDTVRIGAARSDAPGANAPKIAILFEEAGLVACAKPAGLPTVPDQAGASHSLIALVAREIGWKGPHVLRVTSRLDRDVSGVVVFALDSAADERLRTARAAGTYERRYIALASMSSQLGERGIWNAPIGRASNPRLRRARGPYAKDATTRWRKIATAGHGIAMLAVDPVTGRTHQIRIHASDAGAPLLGDREYGGPARVILPNGRIVAPSRIALHAARVIVPGMRGPLEARAPVPVELVELWSAVGGEQIAWDRALSEPTLSLASMNDE